MLGIRQSEVFDASWERLHTVRIFGNRTVIIHLDIISKKCTLSATAMLYRHQYVFLYGSKVPDYVSPHDCMQSKQCKCIVQHDLLWHSVVLLNKLEWMTDLLELFQGTVSNVESSQTARCNATVFSNSTSSKGASRSRSAESCIYFCLLRLTLKLHCLYFYTHIRCVWR